MSRSPTASTNPTTNPTGTSQSSLCNEYDVNSTRTRDRASANSSGRSSRRRSVDASRWVARASGTTRIRAPASRARQHRSRSSAPGNVAGSNPSSVVKRSVRTSMTAVLT